METTEHNYNDVSSPTEAMDITEITETDTEPAPVRLKVKTRTPSKQYSLLPSPTGMSKTNSAPVSATIGRPEKLPLPSQVPSLMQRLFQLSSDPNLANEPAKVTEEDAVQDESEFVLSRLQSRPARRGWLPDSFTQAFAVIKESLVGEETKNEIDWDFWGQMMNDYEATIRKQHRYYTLMLQKGIPGPIRGLMWQLMSKGKSERYMTMYKSLITRPSKDEKLIVRDLARTYPAHPVFKTPEGPGQQSLFNILKAYSIHDPEVGYCQGIGFIVGPLILNMPDEEAFSVLVTLMKEYGFRDLYSPRLTGLQLRLYQFEELLKEYYPLIAKHLDLLDIKPNMYASQWFLTLFAYRFPLEMVFRIMDIVFAQGYEAVLRFALALVQKNQQRILSRRDFETTLDMLQNDLFDPYIGFIDNFMADAHQIRLSKSKLDKLAQDYVQVAQKNNPDYIEATQLRSENFLLLDRLKTAEADYETLNREHVELANQLIQKTEEVERLERLNEELQENIKVLKQVVQADREGAENAVKDEMEQLAQRNVSLTALNATLQDEIHSLEERLVESKLLLADLHNDKSPLDGISAKQ